MWSSSSAYDGVSHAEVSSSNFEVNMLVLGQNLAKGVNQSLLFLKKAKQWLAN